MYIVKNISYLLLCLVMSYFMASALLSTVIMVAGLVFLCLACFTIGIIRLSFEHVFGGFVFLGILTFFWSLSDLEPKVKSLRGFLGGFMLPFRELSKVKYVFKHSIY
jgi:hypothetical protein